MTVIHSSSSRCVPAWIMYELVGVYTVNANRRWVGSQWPEALSLPQNPPPRVNMPPVQIGDGHVTGDDDCRSTPLLVSRTRHETRVGRSHTPLWALWTGHIFV